MPRRFRGTGQTPTESIQLRRTSQHSDAYRLAQQEGALKSLMAEQLATVGQPYKMRIPETVPEDWRWWTKIPHRDASLRDGSAYRQTEDGRIFKMRDPNGKYVGQMVSQGGALWSKLTQEIIDEQGEFGFFLIARGLALAAGGGAGAGYRTKDLEIKNRVRRMSPSQLRKVSKERWRQKSVRMAARKELARRSKRKKQKALEAKRLRDARRAAREEDSLGGISKSQLRSMSSGKLKRIMKSVFRKKSIKAAARKELKRRSTDKRWKKKAAAEGRKETAALRALTKCRSGGDEMGFTPLNPVLDQIGEQLMFGDAEFGASTQDDYLKKEGLTYAHNFNVDLYANRDLNTHGMWRQGAMESAGQALATHLTSELFPGRQKPTIMYHEPELERRRRTTRRLQRGQPDPHMGSANHDDGVMDRHMGLDYDWYEETY
jgi:hypothetical protein